MKGQDIGLLLKLVCLQRHESRGKAMATWPHDWKDWEDLGDDQLPPDQDRLDVEAGITNLSPYTARALELQTGISKTQINLSLKHCMDIGLAKTDRKQGVPRANTVALFEFIVFGLKYVFPVRAGELTRGIATSFAAPVLAKSLNQCRRARACLVVCSWQHHGNEGRAAFQDCGRCGSKRSRNVRPVGAGRRHSNGPAPRT